MNTDRKRILIRCINRCKSIFCFIAPMLPMVFKSIDLYWPKNIGRCIIAIDATIQNAFLAQWIPDYCVTQNEHERFGSNQI